MGCTPESGAIDEDESSDNDRVRSTCDFQRGDTAGDEERELALLINGPAGVGKTSMLDHVGDLLAELGRPFVLMDVDWFHRSWPPNTEGNRDVEAQTMGMLWRGYRAGGPRLLVVSGYVSSAASLHRYERALGVELLSIGLSAPVDVLRERLRRRHANQPGALAWHLDHLPEMLGALAAGAPDRERIHAECGRSGALQVLAAFDRARTARMALRST